MTRSGGDRGERWPDDRAGPYRPGPAQGPRSRPRPPAGQNDQYPGQGSGRRRPAGRDDHYGRPPGRRAKRPGALPGRYGIVVVIGSAALGGLLTALTGGQPGTLLGVFLVVGTLAAGSVVRPAAVHLIIPVPALAYLVAAMLAGIAAIPASQMSRTGLAVNALQWIAHGFAAMVIATAFAIVITVARRRARSRPAGLRTR